MPMAEDALEQVFQALHHVHVNRAMPKAATVKKKV